MRCYICRGGFKEGDVVVPLLRYVTRESKGDFVVQHPEHFAHADHLRDSAHRTR